MEASMVQADQTTHALENEYDSSMDERPEREPHQPDWADLVRKTVNDLASAVGESSRQLSSAAERFAGQSMSWVEQVANRVQQSAAVSQEMAEAANQAAEDARRTAEGVQGAIEGAAQRVQEQARRLFQDASDKLSSQAGEASEKVNQAAASASERFGEDSRRLLEEFSARIEESLTLTREAAERANQAANQAQQAAREAAATASRPAGDVLERLETEYHTLNQLVQDLHSRISGLAGRERTIEPNPPPPEQEEVREITIEQAYEESETRDEPQTWQPEGQASEAPAETAASPGAAMALQGRVIVTLAPVPDFDKLLGLDAALGRIGDVRNVTLSDFAREEVTFRVDIEGSVEVESFVDQLASSAHERFEVVSFAPGDIRLRIQPAS